MRKVEDNWELITYLIGEMFILVNIQGLHSSFAGRELKSDNFVVGNLRGNRLF